MTTTKRAELFALSLLAVLTCTSLAQDARSAATLKGLKTVFFRVQSFGGIPKEPVAKEAEQALRAAGIEVLGENEWQSNPDTATLDLTMTLTCSGASCGYTVRLGLIQRVVLSRDSTVTTTVPTWYDGYQNAIGRGEMSALPQLVTVDADTLIKAFVREYLSVNPK